MPKRYLPSADAKGATMSVHTQPGEVGGLHDADAKRAGDAAAQFVMEWYGERCPDWEKDCVVCRMWDAIDQLTGQREPRYHERTDAPAYETVRVSNSVNVDLDVMGDIVGVEIL